MVRLTTGVHRASISILTLPAKWMMAVKLNLCFVAIAYMLFMVLCHIRKESVVLIAIVPSCNHMLKLRVVEK